MPAIKKFESLDNGDSIYSASRKVSKTQIKNMIPPQPLTYDSSQYNSLSSPQLGLSQSNISNGIKFGCLKSKAFQAAKYNPI